MCFLYFSFVPLNKKVFYDVLHINLEFSSLLVLVAIINKLFCTIPISSNVNSMEKVVDFCIISSIYPIQQIFLLGLSSSVTGAFCFCFCLYA